MASGLYLYIFRSTSLATWTVPEFLVLGSAYEVLHHFLLEIIF